MIGLFFLIASYRLFEVRVPNGRQLTNFLRSIGTWSGCFGNTAYFHGKPMMG